MSKRFRRVDRIIRREVGTDVLLFDPRNDSLHVLNPTAAFVWDHLGTAATVADLDAALRVAYEVAADARVAEDIERVLGDLCGRGLVSPLDDPDELGGVATVGGGR